MHVEVAHGPNLRRADSRTKATASGIQIMRRLAPASKSGGLQFTGSSRKTASSLKALTLGSKGIEWRDPCGLRLLSPALINGCQILALPEASQAGESLRKLGLYG